MAMVATGTRGINAKRRAAKIAKPPRIAEKSDELNADLFRRFARKATPQMRAEMKAILDELDTVHCNCPVRHEPQVAVCECECGTMVLVCADCLEFARVTACPECSKLAKGKA